MVYTALPVELNMIRMCNAQLQFPQLKVSVHLHGNRILLCECFNFVLLRLARAKKSQLAAITIEK